MRRLEPYREWKESSVGGLEFCVRRLPGGLLHAIVAGQSTRSGSSEKAVPRHFTAEYKLNILRQAEDCREKGEIGALLRREGLYSSHPTTWRRQRDGGIFSALKPKQRGVKANPLHPLQSENEKLREENTRLQKRLKKAELIIDIQKQISQLLGIPLENSEIGEDD